MPPPSAWASVRTPLAAASAARAAVVGPLPRTITSGSSAGSETRMRAPSRSGERTRPTAPAGSPASVNAGRSTSSTSAVTVRNAALPVRRTAALRLLRSCPATSTATFGRASKLAPTAPIGMRRVSTCRPFSSVHASSVRPRGKLGEPGELLREGRDARRVETQAVERARVERALRRGDVRGVRLEDRLAACLDELGRAAQRLGDRAVGEGAHRRMRSGCLRLHLPTKLCPRSRRRQSRHLRSLAGSVEPTPGAHPVFLSAAAMPAIERRSGGTQESSPSR